jgi:hypothetical protein
LLVTLTFIIVRLERDAQLLANRIALLKQEEMKTWKKIEETKKKTGDILGLKRRNEDRVRKVSSNIFVYRYSSDLWTVKFTKTSSVKSLPTTTCRSVIALKKRIKYRLQSDCRRPKKLSKLSFFDSKTNRRRNTTNCVCSKKIL